MHILCNLINFAVWCHPSLSYTCYRCILKHIISKYTNQYNWYNVMHWLIVCGEHCHPTYRWRIFNCIKLLKKNCFVTNTISLLSHFDIRHVVHSWMFQCNIILLQHCNVSFWIIHLIMSHKYFWLSQFHINFHSSHDVQSIKFCTALSCIDDSEFSSITYLLRNALI